MRRILGIAFITLVVAVVVGIYFGRSRNLPSENWPDPETVVFHQYDHGPSTFEVALAEKSDLKRKVVAFLRDDQHSWDLLLATTVPTLEVHSSQSHPRRYSFDFTEDYINIDFACNSWTGDSCSYTRKVESQDLSLLKELQELRLEAKSKDG